MITGHFNELEFHIIELQKFRNLDIMKPKKKDFWLWFIDHTNKELIQMACVTNKEIEEARKQLDKIRANKELMERIRLQEIFEMDEATSLDEAEKRGIKKGIEQGIEQGINQNKKEIAIKLIKLNLPLEQIVTATGLSLAEIQELKSKIN